MFFARVIGIFLIILSCAISFAHDISTSYSEISKELSLIRKPDAGPFRQDSFGAMIDEQVRWSLSGQNPFSSWMKRAFKITDPEPVGLATHRMCSAGSVKLHKAPTASLKIELGKFISQYNKKLEKADMGGIEQMWRRFFYCLAKEESLRNADSRIYEANARRLGIVRPKGVVFHSDRMHVSGNSIGVFQFAPVMDGNIRPCIELWNEKFSEFKIPLRGDIKVAAKILGSSAQAFNIFCGVNKVVQSFYVQINSRNLKYTNQEKRCVTFNKFAYLHFGPLMNSTGKNLESVLRCAAI